MGVVNQQRNVARVGVVERSEIVHLGWDDAWEDVLRRSGASGEPGRLIRVERGESDVGVGDEVLRAQSDSQRSQSDMAPVTGDWVTLIDEDGDPVIEHILDRRTELVRRDPGERGEEQPLSANVDVVFLVHGFDRPLRAGKLERFLVLAWNAGATPVVVLTKADLAEPGDVEDLTGIIGAVAPGVQVVVTSSESGLGLDRIRSLLEPNRTGTMLGESGSGKSTLVNALLDSDVQDTNTVRSSDSKGRHTTITRDLLVLPTGGVVIDTPGIRAVGLWDAEDALQQVFSDITELAAHCRFGDCAHGAEPGCAVTEAVESGVIDWRRLDRYQAMTEELAELDARVQARERNSNRRSRGGGRRRRH